MPYRLPRWQLILYASGSLATALSYQAFSTYIQFLYIDVYGVRAVWIGLVWSIYGLWNAINDPLSGYLSDRYSSRWGRRIPWIATTFVPLSITFYLLFVPPAGVKAGGESALLFYFSNSRSFSLLYSTENQILGQNVYENHFYFSRGAGIAGFTSSFSSCCLICCGRLW